MTDPARLVLAGFDGTTADAPSIARLLDLGVGGLLLFGRNVESPGQVRDLLAGGLEQADRPLLLAVDQEGGRVARLKAPLTVWPPMAAVGARADQAMARAVGRALAAEVGAVGFNFVLAPVLDVRFEGTTDAIGDRALSDDPERVARLGLALAAGIADAGLLACAKHFPGHGHVTMDSHVDMPVCSLDADALEARCIAPFAAAAEADIDAIMTAHVLYPALDPEHPATLSERIVQGLLRERLGYDGAVLTDDMEMGAIVRRHGVPGACVRSVGAGVDGVLVCQSLDRIERTVEALRDTAERDASFARRCDDAAGRLHALAVRAPAHPAPPAALADRIGRPEHAALASRLVSSGADAGADPTRYPVG